MDKMNELESRFNETMEEVYARDAVGVLDTLGYENLREKIEILDEIKNEAYGFLRDEMLRNGQSGDFDPQEHERIVALVNRLTNKIYDATHDLSIEERNKHQEAIDNMKLGGRLRSQIKLIDGEIEALESELARVNEKLKNTSLIDAVKEDLEFSKESLIKRIESFKTARNDLQKQYDILVIDVKTLKGERKTPKKEKEQENNEELDGKKVKFVLRDPKTGEPLITYYEDGSRKLHGLHDSATINETKTDNNGKEPGTPEKDPSPSAGDNGQKPETTEVDPGLKVKPWTEGLPPGEPKEGLLSKVKNVFKKAKNWLKEHSKQLIAGTLVVASLATGIFAGSAASKKKSYDEGYSAGYTAAYDAGVEAGKNSVPAPEVVETAEPEIEVVDISNLDALIDLCEEVDPSLYTPESYNNMWNQKLHADRILAGDYTQDTINEEYGKLNEAYNALELLEVSQTQSSSSGSGSSGKNEEAEEQTEEQEENRGQQIFFTSGGSRNDGGSDDSSSGGDGSGSGSGDGNNPPVEIPSSEFAYLSTSEQGPSEYVFENPDGTKTVISADGIAYLVDKDGNVIGQQQAPDNVYKGEVSIDGQNYGKVDPNAVEGVEFQEGQDLTGDETVVTEEDLEENSALDEAANAYLDILNGTDQGQGQQQPEGQGQTIDSQGQGQQPVEAALDEQGQELGSGGPTL